MTSDVWVTTNGRRIGQSRFSIDRIEASLMQGWDRRPFLLYLNNSSSPLRLVINGASVEQQGEVTYFKAVSTFNGASSEVKIGLPLRRGDVIQNMNTGSTIGTVEVIETIRELQRVV